ncbi:MAG: hypothetical protein JXB30_18715 [Anaerolineae bacterium]|nr:hypothetical protein [Anaerolineae bacterium]
MMSSPRSVSPRHKYSDNPLGTLADAAARRLRLAGPKASQVRRVDAVGV